VVVKIAKTERSDKNKQMEGVWDAGGREGGRRENIDIGRSQEKKSLGRPHMASSMQNVISWETGGKKPPMGREHTV